MMRNPRTCCVSGGIANTHETCKIKNMNLREYIEKMGDEKAAKLFQVKPRTVMSWRLGDRTPRPKQAKIIVEKSPVTMEGIYGGAA